MKIEKKKKGLKKKKGQLLLRATNKVPVTAKAPKATKKNSKNLEQNSEKNLEQNSEKNLEQNSENDSKKLETNSEKVEDKQIESEGNEKMEVQEETSKREKGKSKVEGKPKWWRDVSVMNENQKRKYFKSLAIHKYKVRPNIK